MLASVCDGNDVSNPVGRTMPPPSAAFLATPLATGDDDDDSFGVLADLDKSATPALPTAAPASTNPWSNLLPLSGATFPARKNDGTPTVPSSNINHSPADQDSTNLPTIPGASQRGPGMDWTDEARYDETDDFADDLEYLQYRDQHGRDLAFEAARAQWRRQSRPGWTFSQFNLFARLKTGDWLNGTPTLLAEYLGIIIQQLAVPGENRFDDGVTSIKEFLGRDCTTTYLVEDVLPAGQLCIAGGPEKGQKSNLLLDLAVSVAAGKRWLNHFNVPNPKKVLILTGETQGANLQNILWRVMTARGVNENDIADRLMIKEAVPTLDNPGQLMTLRAILQREQIDIVILDPLYFALGEIDTHRLTQVGSAIANVARMCADAGATLVLAHHMSKSAQMRRGEEREPMQLADLNGAGFGPVAGSWILINYLVPYDPETGACLVWLNVGGRAGHGGLYTVAIEEGRFVKNQPLNGRNWHTAVAQGQKVKEIAQEIKNEKAKDDKDAKLKAKAAEEEKRMEEIRAWLAQREPNGAIQADIAAKFGLSPKVVKLLLMAMLERVWIAHAQKRPGDNSNSHRWRVITAPLAAQQVEALRGGAKLEDVLAQGAA